MSQAIKLYKYYVDMMMHGDIPHGVTVHWDMPHGDMPYGNTLYWDMPYGIK